MKPCRLKIDQKYLYTGGAVNCYVTHKGYAKSGYLFFDEYGEGGFLTLLSREVSEFIREESENV
jgi:hypothetical protein